MEFSSFGIPEETLEKQIFEGTIVNDETQEELKQDESG